MFVSHAQAPYDGVYQRQPTGLPKPEFIPQYTNFSSEDVKHSAKNGSTSNAYQTGMQHSPQLAYQNGCNGQIYVPEMNGKQVSFFFFFHTLNLSHCI